MTKNISKADKRHISGLFTEAADILRKRYDMTVPQAKRELQRILDDTV